MRASFWLGLADTDKIDLQNSVNDSIKAANQTKHVGALLSCTVITSRTEFLCCKACLHLLHLGEVHTIEIVTNQAPGSDNTLT